jgi:hypothetical protein
LNPKQIKEMRLLKKLFLILLTAALLSNLILTGCSNNPKLLNQAELHPDATSIYHLNTVGISNTTWAMGAPYQRYSFFTATKYWCFYSDGTNMGFKTNADGVTWSSFTPIRACDAGYQFSVAFDGTNFHYVYCNTNWDGELYYRMGIANSDGTIVWSAAEQTVLTVNSSHLCTDPSISVDSNGYPWIAYGYGVTGYNTYAYVAKSSKKNGTWTHESTLFTSPYQFSNVTFNEGISPSAWCVVKPLTSGKMYALVQTDCNLAVSGAEKNMKGRLWDGYAWGNEETPVSSNYIGSACVALVTQGNNIHMTYTTWDGITAITYYTERTYGVGWVTPAIIRTHAVASQATLSIDNSGILYCFWVNDPVANHLYYKKCISGIWDADPIDLETSSEAVSAVFVNVSDKEYNGVITFNCSTLASSPYNIKFIALAISGMKR